MKKFNLASLNPNRYLFGSPISKRATGILLPIFSLPSPYGIGDFGPEAIQFVKFLKKAKQSYWQILPLHPTSALKENSPYSCNSAFAGNVLFISPDFLMKGKWISRKDLGRIPKFSSRKVDYKKVSRFKLKILKKAFQNYKRRKKKSHRFEKFCKEHEKWLCDYGLFLILKKKYKGKPWNKWPQKYKTRNEKALVDLKENSKKLLEEIYFYQFLFEDQWENLKHHCEREEVKIIGDIPFYSDFDSVDVWISPESFKLNKDLKPQFVSGVPPDYFSRTGQRWGNPIYDWKVLEKANYEWWFERLEHQFRFFDLVRLDHFRAFASFYQIPSQNKTAMKGKWRVGPRAKFFDAAKKRFKTLSFIAEDLGYITKDVRELRDQFRFPGMKVAQFAFNRGYKKNMHLPDNYTKNFVAYTGTHDNNTTRGWFERDASKIARNNLKRYLGKELKPEEVVSELIRRVSRSKAILTIFPIQDFLFLGSSARINQPGTVGANWRWRLRKKYLTKKLRDNLEDLAKISGRD